MYNLNIDYRNIILRLVKEITTCIRTIFDYRSDQNIFTKINNLKCKCNK